MRGSVAQGIGNNLASFAVGLWRAKTEERDFRKFRSLLPDPTETLATDAMEIGMVGQAPGRHL